MRVLPNGDRAVLVEVDDLAAVITLHASLRSAALPGVRELVPGARTLLVTFDPTLTSADALALDLSRPRPEPAAASAGDAAPLIEIPTVYRGADLSEVAALTGLSDDGVVARHTAADYTVAFCGFSPGFGYLTGGDPQLRVPRRDTPRTRVPAGAVAIADAFTGVYPRELPGGWRLIGQTSLPMWDLDRDPPAVLVPGTRVRFVPVPK
jgi:KipI family sensor histidine kinase inhibitor